MGPLLRRAATPLVVAQLAAGQQYRLLGPRPPVRCGRYARLRATRLQLATGTGTSQRPGGQTGPIDARHHLDVNQFELGGRRQAQPRFSTSRRDAAPVGWPALWAQRGVPGR